MYIVNGWFLVRRKPRFSWFVRLVLLLFAVCTLLFLSGCAVTAGLQSSSGHFTVRASPFLQRGMGVRNLTPCRVEVVVGDGGSIYLAPGESATIHPPFIARSGRYGDIRVDLYAKPAEPGCYGYEDETVTFRDGGAYPWNIRGIRSCDESRNYDPCRSGDVGQTKHPLETAPATHIGPK